MNQIVDRQNQEKYLKIQYSARTCYNLVELLSVLAWILSIVNVVVDIMMPDKLIIKVYIVAGCTLLVILMQYLISRITCYAAAFRMYFDYKMYGWENRKYNNLVEEELLEKASIIVRLRKKDSQIRMCNNGEQNPPGVKDWYDNIAMLSDGNKLINACQQQNMWWTRKINSIQEKIFIGITGVVFVLLFIKFFHCELSIFVSSFLSVISLIINLVIEIRRNSQHKDVIKKFEFYNQCLNKHENMSMEELKELQELIDERRNIPVLTLNIIHDKGARFFHKLYRNRSDIT